MAVVPSAWDLGAIVDCHQMFRGRCQILSSKIFNQWEFQSSIICPSGTAKRIGFGEQTIFYRLEESANLVYVGSEKEEREV